MSKTNANERKHFYYVDRNNEIHRFRSMTLSTGGKIFLNYEDAKEAVRKASIPATNMPKIEKVIYNGPATTVIFDDKTKVTVKCQLGDPWDDLTGVLAAIAKRAYGGTGHYNTMVEKAIDAANEDCEKRAAE